MNLVSTFAVLLCATLVAACAPTASKKDASEAATVAATAPVAAAAAAPAVVQEEEDRMICKMIIPTGSRIGTKACRRASQWEQMTRDGRDAAERVQRMGSQKPIPNG